MFNRISFLLTDPVARDEAARLCSSAPDGTFVQFIDETKTRSDKQNKKMWPMLNDLSQQLTWPPKPMDGIQISPDDWKLVMMEALGHETRMIPNSRLTGFIDLGRSSKALKVKEFSDLIEVIYEFGIRYGVKFKQPKPKWEDD